MSLKILFMGTPHYGAVILDGLANVPDVVLRVVTQPDAPAGRGYQHVASPVARWAEDHGVDVDRPKTLKENRGIWQEFSPDVLVTAAYGKILAPWVLALPRTLALNVHASLLPRWRGPNPIAWAIRSGDPFTGVTLMGMDAGVDTGPIYARRELAIGADMDVGQLTEALAFTGRDLLLDSLPDILSGKLDPVPQDPDGVVHAPKFTADDARISWEMDAIRIAAGIRSMSPSPAAYTMFRGKRVQILSAQVEPPSGLLAGHLALDRRGLMVGALPGSLRIDWVKPEGKRAMSGMEWARGARLGEQERFT